MRILLALLLFISSCSCPSKKNESLKVGILYAEVSFPLLIAAEENLFAAKGLDVELIPFDSALELNQAFQAGNLDFIISDLVSSTVMKSRGIPLKIAAVIRGAHVGEGRIALLAAPGKNITTLADLRGKNLALSPKTHMEYVADVLLAEAGLKEGEVEKLIVTKMPLRVNLLLEGKIDAAMLPDPLAAFAEYKGATLIVDDGKSNLSQIVLSVREETPLLQPFLEAYNEATTRINENQEAYRQTLFTYAKVPQLIWGSYQMRTIPKASPLSLDHQKRVAAWLLEKEIIPSYVTYEELTCHAIPAL